MAILEPVTSIESPFAKENPFAVTKVDGPNTTVCVSSPTLTVRCVPIIIGIWPRAAAVTESTVPLNVVSVAGSYIRMLLRGPGPCATAAKPPSTMADATN